MLDIDLSNKVVLVTGVTGESGTEICKTLAMAGGEVWIHHFKKDHQVEELQQIIHSFGRTAHSIIGELTTPESVKATIEQILTKCKRIDVLINHAEISTKIPLSNLTPEEWNRTFEANLDIPFLCSQEVIPKMEQAGEGIIINISSNAAMTGEIGPHFAASKSAINSLTKGLAREYKDQGIRVIGLSPSAQLNEKKLIEKAGFNIKNALANMILFLCSPYADYLNGETLPFSEEAKK
ncbi:SDR family NAD(P)-dependent oxidoreductase [Heyndrickxia sp. NPDC080065]|uniref:SDR family NAD(P)-dependent oxidoreductase n=1 Tax=Heyndrickxia sp. NPDC080065 TaxID=3390568 RepID=UPI003D085757